MALSKLTLLPDNSAYTVQDGKEIVSVQLDGGASRRRRDVLGAASRVSCKWICDELEYKYLRAFYKTRIASGADSFLIDLILDEPSLVECRAAFVPNSMVLQDQKGLTYFVSAELEVIPNVADTVYDESLVTIFENYQQGSYVFLNTFEMLVNVQLPEAFK